MLAGVRQNLRYKLKVLPAKTASRLSRVGPIDRRLEQAYRRALLQHRAALPSLSGLDREICGGLEQKGVFVTSLADLALPMSGEILETGRKLAANFASEARTRAEAGEKFLMVPPGLMAREADLFAWGVQDRLLDIIETYLGLPPAYDGTTILYTVANGDEEATRRWHRDREDRRMVKIIIYLTDVAKGDGPFQLDPVPKAAATNDDRRSIISCEGKAGTVIFADTARFFHRGAPSTQRDRAAIFYSYFSCMPRYPFFCERSGLTRAQIAALTKDFAPRQLEATLWHDGLPWPLRLIPSMPI